MASRTSRSKRKIGETTPTPSKEEESSPIVTNSVSAITITPAEELQPPEAADEVAATSGSVDGESVACKRLMLQAMHMPSLEALALQPVSILLY